MHSRQDPENHRARHCLRLNLVLNIDDDSWGLPLGERIISSLNYLSWWLFQFNTVLIWVAICSWTLASITIGCWKWRVFNGITSVFLLWVFAYVTTRLWRKLLGVCQKMRKLIRVANTNKAVKLLKSALDRIYPALSSLNSKWSLFIECKTVQCNGVYLGNK